MSDSGGAKLSFNSHTLAIVIAALGSLAAIVSAWGQLAPGTPELTASVLSVEEFTAKPDFEGLSGNFSYKGNQVEKLVNIRVAIKNSGNKTIIGKGSKKNVIDEGITVDVPAEFEIVETKLLESDFTPELLRASNSFKISFEQWRSNEKIVISTYLKANNTNVVPTLLKKKRELIDGDFIIIDAENTRGVNPLIEYMPSQYVNGLKTFGFLTLSLVFPMSLFFAFEILRERSSASSWRTFNQSDFDTSLHNLGIFSEEEQDRLRSDPSLITSFLWKKLECKKYPTLLSESLKESVMWLVIFLLVALGCVPLFVGLVFMY